MAGADDFAYLDWPGPIPFAHRGGASEVPENTLPAFAHAVGLGYRYVETDVHLTADGVLLAFHDDVLDRVTDRTGVVAELPWSEVREARVGGTEPIPLLEDLLTTWPELRVNIDPKHDAAVDPLVEVLRRTGAVDRSASAPFSDDRIARVREALPGHLHVARARGLPPAGSGRHRDTSIGRPRRRPAPSCRRPTATPSSSPPSSSPRPTAAACRCTCGPSTSPTRWLALLDLGVDGIMTDRPAVLKDVLGARGEWHEA